MSFRIASLSGGGIRGIFQAVYLEKVAKALPRPLHSNFELIAGTSTGAIIALAVALEIDLNRVADLFRVHGSSIFSRRWFSSVRTGARYSSAPLRQALESVFGTKTLRQCAIPVVLPATALDKFGVRCISTLDEGDKDLAAVDAALASCAAPTYFPPVKPKGQNRTYVDGGLWANNPALAAAMLVFDKQNIPFKDMKVLSIGNGERPSGAMKDDYTKLRPITESRVVNATVVNGRGV